MLGESVFDSFTSVDGDRSGDEDGDGDTPGTSPSGVTVLPSPSPFPTTGAPSFSFPSAGASSCPAGL